MNLESALQEMYAYYVAGNGDPDGFISDLAIILDHDEDVAHGVALNVAETRSDAQCRSWPWMSRNTQTN